MRTRLRAFTAVIFLPALVPYSYLNAADKVDAVFADRKLSEWVADLRSDDGRVRSYAQRVVPLIGAKAAAVLPELLEIAAYERLAFDLNQSHNSILRERVPVASPGSPLVSYGPGSSLSPFEEVVLGLGREALPALTEGLKHPFPGVREKAARALRLLGPDAKRSVGQLVKLLEDPYPMVASEALTSAMAIDPTSPEVLAVLAARLKEKDPVRRSNAARTLLAIQPTHRAAREVLTESAFSDWDAQRAGVDRQFLLSLRPTPWTTVEYLLRQIADANYFIRYQAGAALARIESLEPGAVPVVIDAAKKAKRSIVWNLLLPAIGRSANGSKETIAFLVEQAQAGPWSERFKADLPSKSPSAVPKFDLAAVEALGLVGPPAKALATSILKPALKSALLIERRAAALALAQIDPSDADAVSAVIQMRFDPHPKPDPKPDPEPDPKFKPELNLGALIHFEPLSHADRALQRMNKAALPVLREAMKSRKDPNQQGVLARYILMIEPNDKDAIAVQLAAERFVGHSWPPLKPLGKAAVPCLRAMLKDGQARPNALPLLAELGPDGAAAVTELADLLKAADTDPTTRAAAALVLGRIGSGAKDAVPALSAALKESSLHLRLCAAEALQQIDPKAGELLPAVRELVKLSEDPERQRLTEPTIVPAPKPAPAAKMAPKIITLNMDPHTIRKRVIALYCKVDPEAAVKAGLLGDPVPTKRPTPIPPVKADSPDGLPTFPPKKVP